MGFFRKQKTDGVERPRISELDASFIYITNFHTKPHPCKLINLTHSNGIGIVTKIPLFKNDHLIIKYNYNNIEFEQEAIVSDKLKGETVLKFLSFTDSEQETLDNLILASLRKRF